MRKTVAGILVAAAGAALPAPSAAADVTIGSSLAGTPDRNICVQGYTCTYVQTSGGYPVAVSPIDGRVVRWRLKAGSTTGDATLRVLRPSGSSFTAIASSAKETVSSALNTYTTNLPIKKGDAIGLDNSSSGLYFTSTPAVSLPLVKYFQPALANGMAGTPTYQAPDVELLLNADVAPLAPGPNPTPAPAETPAIGKLRLNPVRFRAAASGASVTRKRPPIGTTVSYTLSADATVTFRVKRGRPGRKRGGRCRRASRHARGRRCTRYVAVPGSFALAGRSGANRFAFSGRVAGQKLRKGRYRLIATPATDQKTGAPARARFRIG